MVHRADTVNRAIPKIADAARQGKKPGLQMYTTLLAILVITVILIWQTQPELESLKIFVSVKLLPLPQRLLLQLHHDL